MKLKDIMTKNVESVSGDAPILTAAQRMATEEVGFLPVLGSDGIIGVVTDRDIVVRGIVDNHDPETTPIREIMTHNVEVLSEDEDIKVAAKLMQEKQIRRILVRGENDRYVGVVSLGDLAVRMQSSDLSGDVLERVCEPEPVHG